MLHVNFIMLHVDMIYLACSRQNATQNMLHVYVSCMLTWFILHVAGKMRLAYQPLAYRAIQIVLCVFIMSFEWLLIYYFHKPYFSSLDIT